MKSSLKLKSIKYVKVLDADRRIARVVEMIIAKMMEKVA